MKAPTFNTMIEAITNGLCHHDGWPADELQAPAGEIFKGPLMRDLRIVSEGSAGYVYLRLVIAAEDVESEESTAILGGAHMIVARPCRPKATRERSHRRAVDLYNELRENVQRFGH